MIAALEFSFQLHLKMREIDQWLLASLMRGTLWMTLSRAFKCLTTSSRTALICFITR
jgi:hypothetical protein